MHQEKLQSYIISIQPSILDIERSHNQLHIQRINARSSIEWKAGQENIYVLGTKVGCNCCYLSLTTPTLNLNNNAGIKLNWLMLDVVNQEKM